MDYLTITFDEPTKCYTFVYGEDATTVIPQERMGSQVECMAKCLRGCENATIEQVDDLTWKVTCA